ncbi:DEAD-box ATP-dependent RNA helicase 50 isoform X2 [Coffea arabica]|uniref:DEAD-box ATP-dependent RNA helicase 50 isoform X2 n=1 Tax=Coffea arabica TaxID=13443 RepID=A0A6P6X1I4_COFAR|nr:DEAD-box ATP-dependent RNA helicase 50-like isoform X2 [Coffea arabica]
MLAYTSMAAASLSSSLPINFQIDRKLSFNLQLINHQQRAMRVKMVVRAGRYTRLSLDTPGAYQLIDNETGEKFIVWGGEENDPPNSPIPSQQVLSWEPFSSNSKRRGNSDGADDSVGSPGSGGLARSFGRLKAQRVKALVRRSHRKIQETNDLDHLEQNAHNTRLQLAESKDILQNILTNDHKEHHEISFRRETGQLPKDQCTPTEDQLSDFSSAESDVSVSRASSTTLRGWGSRESRDIYRQANNSAKRRNMNDKHNFFSKKSFKDLGCRDYVIECLRGLHFLQPSHIQAMAFEPVIGGKSCIIADQSGSGKTLAYLLPIVQRLREEELQGISKSMSNSPRVVVLVPTAELASQVLSISRSLSKLGIPFRSMVTTGGFRQKTQLENLKQELDVLIATPGRFMFLMKEGFLQFKNLKCAVLDEVDILFNDEDFELALQCLMNTSPITTQYLFVTATLPVEIYNHLVEAFPDCDAIMGPGMHRTSRGLEEILVDCSGEDPAEKSPETAFLNKKNALLHLLEENPVNKTIIFCNKIETCRKVENVLKRIDRKGSMIRVLPFHAALDHETRLANMEEFRGSQMKDSASFLVCTDRASRGIDFAGVDHVVLFDFPRDPSEYVRRVGRTARGAGGKGKAFIFVVGKQVSLARRIIERNRKGHPLHDVPSAYELMT